MCEHELIQMNNRDPNSKDESSPSGLRSREANSERNRRSLTT